MVNYGWICPKCGRVYAPTQAMCLYCGGGSISKQTDSTQPYNPLQDLARATSNKIEKYTTTTLNGVSNLSNCIIEGSGVDTSISASCRGYKNGKCFTGAEEIFETNCEGNISRCIHSNELKPNKVAR